MMFWARPGSSREPRTIRMTAARTTTITIHIVRIVLLMLGWKTTSWSGLGAFAGSKSMTVAGAGNSRAFWMKQAGNGQSGPAVASFGVWGKTMKAAMSRMMTMPIRRNQRLDRPRPDGDDGGGGVGVARGAAA